MKFWSMRHEADVCWGLWERISSMEKVSGEEAFTLLPHNAVLCVMPGVTTAIA